MNRFALVTGRIRKNALGTGYQLFIKEKASVCQSLNQGRQPGGCSSKMSTSRVSRPSFLSYPPRSLLLLHPQEVSNILILTTEVTTQNCFGSTTFFSYLGETFFHLHELDIYINKYQTVSDVVNCWSSHDLVICCVKAY